MSINKLSISKLVLVVGQVLTLVGLIGCSKEITLDQKEAKAAKLQAKASAKTMLESSSITVMDNNYDLVYLGVILKGKEIIDSATFNPISGYTKLPIRISSSLAGSTSRTISIPRLSTFRQATRDLLNAIPNLGPDISSFHYYSRPFYDYSELKQMFGYNVKTRSLFSTTNTSIIDQLTTIRKKNGLVVGFEIVNFTLDMSLPKATELIEETALKNLLSTGDRPVYISSVSFGQKGVLAIESDYSKEETNRVFEKITKKIFKKSTESLTTSEINIINNTTIRVFLVGGSNAGAVTQINGYDAFVSYIQDIGTFTASNPGFPISFRCRELSDFSLFKISY